MKILIRIQKILLMLSLLPRTIVIAIQILPSYILSIGSQRISAKQLRRILDSKTSSVQVTPIVSYIDWTERNDAVGLFENYSPLPEYQWVKTYYSKVDRMHFVASFLQATRDVPGDIGEFGVYKGHTAILLNQVRENWMNEKRIHLFDSFEGLPDEIGDDDDFVAGQFSDTSVEKVRQVVGGGDQVNIVKGFFSQTFSTVPDLRFSFCHIDCDLEIAVLECLEYIYPRLLFGGVIVFDDYGFRACLGLRNAVDRFFAEKNQRVISLPTSQAVYIKLNASQI